MPRMNGVQPDEISIVAAGPRTPPGAARHVPAAGHHQHAHVVDCDRQVDFACSEKYVPSAVRTQERRQLDRLEQHADRMDRPAHQPEEPEAATRSIAHRIFQRTPIIFARTISRPSMGVATRLIQVSSSRLRGQRVRPADGRREHRDDADGRTRKRRYTLNAPRGDCCDRARHLPERGKGEVQSPYPTPPTTTSETTSRRPAPRRLVREVWSSFHSIASSPTGFSAENRSRRLLPSRQRGRGGGTPLRPFLRPEHRAEPPDGHRDEEDPGARPAAPSSRTSPL